MIRVQPTIEMTGNSINNSINNSNSSAAGYLNLKPLRELDKNFDVDIASWWVLQYSEMKYSEVHY